MDIDFIISGLGLLLSTWVLLSPRWRLAGLRRQHDPLEDSLIENPQIENDTDLSYWLPSWFFLSVAVMVLWCWFFWGSSKIVRSAGSWLWSDPNIYIQISILLSVIFNIVWLVWLCLLNYKKTLLCVAAGTLAIITVCGFALLFKGSNRYYLLGVVVVALTVASNICRINSSARPQFSKLGLSVAAAGAFAGVLWIAKGFAVDYSSADSDEHGFLKMLFRKNFFWKLSSAIGSLFRGRDFVILLTMVEPMNFHMKIEQNWLWFLQQVEGRSRSLQQKLMQISLWFRQQAAGSADVLT